MDGATHGRRRPTQSSAPRAKQTYRREDALVSTSRPATAYQLAVRRVATHRRANTPHVDRRLAVKRVPIPQGVG